MSKPLIAKDVSDAVDAYANGHTKGFNQIIGILQSASVQPEVLLVCLNGLLQSLPHLEREHESLIGALLSVDWLAYDEHIRNKYIAFLLELISLKSFYVNACLSSLVKKLIPKNVPKEKEDIDKNDEHSNATRNIIFNVIKIVPVAEKFLNNHIRKFFPYILGKPTFLINSYMINILKIGFQLSSKTRYDVLALCVDKLLSIDVRISREELEQSNEDELQFQVETPIDENCHINKLDTLMFALFDFLRTVFSMNINKSSSKNELIYRDIIHVFHDVILKTQQSHHVQFMVFYVNSFDKKFSQLFLSECWEIFENPNNAQLTRQSAASYIASFLARAKYVGEDTVKVQLSKLSAWIHKYLDNQDSNNLIASCQKHLPFYSACQAAFYIFIYHHKYLVSNDKLKEFTKSLNFLRMVTSKLNPLKYCLSAVVDLFARITRMYEIAFCYSVIERNKRNTLLDSFNDGGVTSKSDGYAMFFPFDPYLLQKSSCFVQPLYFHWVDEFSYVTDDDDEQDNQGNTSLDDSDSDGMLPESFDMMCISPGFQTHSFSKSPYHH